MKKSISIIVLAFLAGCSSVVNKNQTEENKIETKIDIEKNLKQSAQNFIDIRLRGDIMNASEFIHPIGWDILKLKYPEETDMYSIKRKINRDNLRDGVKEFQNEYNMTFKVGDVLDSINVNNELIYSLNIIQEGETKYNTLYIESNIIGISNNKGIDWKFIRIDDQSVSQTEKVLLLYYSTEIVQRISSSVFFKREIKCDYPKFQPNERIDKNFVNQFYDYSNSLFKGDPDHAIYYIYSGLFKHYKEIMPGNYSLNEVKNQFKESYIDNLQKEFLLSGNEINFNVNKVFTKIYFEGDIIYTFGYSLIKKSSQECYLMGGEAIAISSDLGKNWKFFEKNDQTVTQILSYSYPDTVITNLLDYKYEK